VRVRRIQSPQNPVVKSAVRIGKSRGAGDVGPVGAGEEVFLIEGPNLIRGALSSVLRPALRQVFYTGRFDKREPELVGALAGASVDMYLVSDRVMGKLSDTEAPQGVAAIAACRPYILGETDLGGGISLLCDGIRDPGNLGTIIRTADAAGARAVVLLEGTCDPFMPKALRASAGSIFNVPVIRARGDDVLERLRQAGVRLCATAPEAGVSIFDADLGPSGVAFVLGNEARGVRPELMSAADITVTIPIRGGAQSLNVTVSAAVCLFEAVRRESNAT
jgi:TrmH family RNA methyltransferase